MNPRVQLLLERVANMETRRGDWLRTLECSEARAAEDRAALARADRDLDEARDELARMTARAVRDEVAAPVEPPKRKR